MKVLIFFNYANYNHLFFLVRDSPLLSYVQPPGGPHPGDSTLTLCPLHLVVLEGHPSPTLLDSLQWLSVSGSSLTCSNMKSAVLNNTVKFIVLVSGVYTIIL